MNYVTRTSMTV